MEEREAKRKYIGQEKQYTKKRPPLLCSVFKGTYAQIHV